MSYVKTLSPSSSPTWSYKDHVIAMQGEQFTATVNQKRIVKPSLAGVRKAIDVALTAKAKEVKIDLPVIYTIRKLGLDDRKTEKIPKVLSGAFTGVDTETFEVTGLKLGKYQQASSHVLPDSPENVALLEAFLKAEAEHNRLRAQVQSRSIYTNLRGFGIRSKRTYDEAVAILRTRYNLAKKGQAE